MRREDLESAYLATDYFVSLPSGAACIRTGEACPAIDARCWAYLTAYNPQSRTLLADENSARMELLKRQISATGFRYFEGEALARDGSWPPEPSLLILEIDEKDAIEFARSFDQAAIVVGRRGESAGLVWIDNCSPPNSP